MIEIKLTNFCLICPDIEPVCEINKHYADEKCVKATGYISCKHREGCKLASFPSATELMDVIRERFMFIDQQGDEVND